MTPQDRNAIDALVANFFSAFSNKHDAARVASVRELVIPEVVVVKGVGIPPEVMTLESFLPPRERLLSPQGELADFEEIETHARTEVFGNVAQRLSLYRKSGVLSGAPFATKGVKTFQFVRTADGWRISAVAWDDARPGFDPPTAL